MTPTRGLALLLAAAAAAGCVRIGSATTRELRTYDLLPEPAPGPPAPAAGPEVLEVRPFTVDPALDRDELVWRRGAVESGAYEGHRWARPPAEAARAIFADAFARAGVCAVVAAEPAPREPDFVLRAHLARCDEVDAGAAWRGQVEVRVSLARRQGGEELLRKTYAATEPAARRNPGEVVAALGRALRRVAAEAARDAGAALARARGDEEERMDGAEGR